MGSARAVGALQRDNPNGRLFERSVEVGVEPPRLEQGELSSGVRSRSRRMAR